MKAEIVLQKEELFKELSAKLAKAANIKNATVTLSAIANGEEVEFTAIKFLVEGDSNDAS